MKPTMVMVTESGHPMIEEGLYDFEDFEKMAYTAASLTAPTNDHSSCVEAFVMFAGSQQKLETHMHLAYREDYGVMDWIANVLHHAKDMPVPTQAFLASIEKTCH